MARRMLLSAAVGLTVAISVVVAAEDPIYPIYEIPRCAEPGLHDGTLADWANVAPGPSLTRADFLHLGMGEGYGINLADLDVTCYLGWDFASQALWIGVERVDDVYINTYAGGAPWTFWQHDGIEFLVDGDHSGGDYSGFTVEQYGDEMAKLLTGYQAQQYSMIPESPDGLTVYSNTAASGWATSLPWAAAGGAAWGSSPTTSVIEGYVTPWDALDWRGPDYSTRSTLDSGRIIGFQISVPDWDMVGTFHAFYTISGLSNTWRIADNFVDGELIGCEGEGCEETWGVTAKGMGSWLPDCGRSAVRWESWGRVKASLR
jgi:hypothetical protein